jgi:hypothetical protein
MSIQEAVDYFESIRNKSKSGEKFKEYVKQTNK